MDDYFDLGTYHRPVTTTSLDAQAWFDRGLVWCYGFNHEEAIRCFERALAADERCAMAHWGIAYAIGPNYNKPWAAFMPDELADAVARAHASVQAALALVGDATPVEQALVAALGHRYPAPAPLEDCTPWLDAYAAAMRGVYARFTDDLEVATLTAEALITRTPWLLWDLVAREPAEGADTAEAIAILERAIARVEAAGPDRHPGLLHLYLHAIEMSPHPERALRAADDLRGLVPDAGHLQHMATHIDVLCGQYRDVVTWNQAAIVADRRYAAVEGADNFYTLYRCHDLHFKLYGALFLGQDRVAIEAGDELLANLPESLLRAGDTVADWLEGFVSTRLHALVRFGRWDEILAETLPADGSLYCVTTAVTRYARGIALAASGRVAEARAEQEAFHAAVARVPDTRYIFNNRWLDILEVPAAMLAGEIAYRAGDYEEAFAHLRRSVALDDGLPYDEPWGWMQPTRHALGALLLEQGRVEEAHDTYRADLGLDQVLPRPCQHPDNVWSLHGYHECLRRLGRDAEAALVRPRLDLALARATVPIRASCFCRRSVAA